MDDNYTTLEDVEDYFKNRTKFQKLRDFVWYQLPRILKDWWWELIHRLHPRHKYHIIRTGLKPGYWDPDTRITFAVFNIAEEFVDGTKDVVNWDDNEGHKDAWAKLTAAVDWWRKNKLKILDVDANLTKEAEKLCEDRNMHLANIASILGYMWYP